MRIKKKTVEFTCFTVTNMQYKIFYFNLTISYT